MTERAESAFAENLLDFTYLSKSDVSCLPQMQLESITEKRIYLEFIFNQLIESIFKTSTKLP